MLISTHKLRSLALLSLGTLGALSLTANAPSLAASPQTEASQTKQAPAIWPMDSSVPRSSGRRQALLFVDPLLYETRTAVLRGWELYKRTGVTITVCLVTDEHVSPETLHRHIGWLVDHAGLHKFHDARGAEATRFNATQSGVCIAYDARGNLCFYGDLSPVSQAESATAGVEAAMKGLSRINGDQGKLIVRPVLGRRLPATLATDHAK